MYLIVHEVKIFLLHVCQIKESHDFAKAVIYYVQQNAFFHSFCLLSIKVRDLQMILFVCLIQPPHGAQGKPEKNYYSNDVLTAAQHS